MVFSGLIKEDFVCKKNVVYLKKKTTYGQKLIFSRVSLF